MDAEVVAGMNKVILQQIAVCHTPIAGIHLQDMIATLRPVSDLDKFTVVRCRMRALQLCKIESNASLVSL